MMDRTTKFALGLGAAFLLLALVLIAGDLLEGGAVLGVVVGLGVAILLSAILRFYLTRKGEVYQDERTQKIHNSSLAISWWVAYLVLAATFLIVESGIVQLTLQNFIPLMFFIMLFIYWVAKVYLSRRRL